MSTAAITTATGINHVDSGRFSSRCCTFRRTHTSADPIRILCIRLALTSALSRPPGFAPCARLMVCVSPWALWLVKDFSCDCMFWDNIRGGGLTGQPMGPQVDTSNIRTILSTNHVDSRSFSSRCWAFRRTHPIADPIRLLGIRLALPLTRSLPSGFVPSTKLMIGASPHTYTFGQIVVVDVEGVGFRPRAVVAGRGVVAVYTRISSQEYVYDK